MEHILLSQPVSSSVTLSVDSTRRYCPKIQAKSMIKEKFSVKISRINSITFGAKYASPVICDGLLCSEPGAPAWREIGGSEGPAAGRTNQRSPVGTWESVQPLARAFRCVSCATAAP